MQSIRELYKIGHGPSSSHTMGPQRASELFKKEFPDADKFRAILFGSLAHTGKGHLTDVAIINTFIPTETEVVFDTESNCPVHPNTMELFAYKGNEEIGFWRVYSVGGGTIRIEGKKETALPDVYPHRTFKEIKKYCLTKRIKLYEYVEEFEGPEIREFLADIWKAMNNSIKEGLTAKGMLPGPLKLERKARTLIMSKMKNEPKEVAEDRLVCAYAFAVAETNASSGLIVTAPTCGASGVLPAVLKYFQHIMPLTENDFINALATAAVIGNLIKTNASVSGSECGCQAEIGSACAMAAAAVAELDKLNIEQIEYSAEIAIEHHLGLTCDPILGIVQIPCIERNAVAAMRAITAQNLAMFLTGSRKISLDMVIETMYQTGKDINAHYRETATGGLAKLYKLEEGQL